MWSNWIGVCGWPTPGGWVFGLWATEWKEINFPRVLVKRKSIKKRITKGFLLVCNLCRHRCLPMLVPMNGCNISRTLILSRTRHSLLLICLSSSVRNQRRRWITRRVCPPLLLVIKREIRLWKTGGKKINHRPCVWRYANLSRNPAASERNEARAGQLCWSSEICYFLRLMRWGPTSLGGWNGQAFVSDWPRPTMSDLIQ